jgi:hypothetical protein
MKESSPLLNDSKNINLNSVRKNKVIMKIAALHETTGGFFEDTMMIG